MIRALLLLAMVPFMCAGGFNGPAPKPRSVVVVMSDDISARQYAVVANAIGVAVENPLSTPRLDSMSATGRTSAFYVHSQCNATRAAFMAQLNQPQNAVVNFDGTMYTNDRTLPDMVCKSGGGKAEACLHIGKRGWQPAQGYCTDTGAPCTIDGNCTNPATCSYAPTESGQVRGGFDQTQGFTNLNPANFCSWTDRQSTRVSATEFSSSTQARTTWVDDSSVAAFAAAWPTTCTSQRCFIWHSTHEAHIPFYGDKQCASCGLGETGCQKLSAERVDADLGSILDTVGTADEENVCIIYVSDNGYFAKGRPTINGTRVPLTFSKGCLRGAAPGNLPPRAYDLDDLGRFIAESMDGWSPATSYPVQTGDIRANGTAREIDAWDIAGELWGFCRGRDCGRHTPHPPVYRWSNTRTAVYDDTYTLLTEVPDGYQAAAETQTFATVIDPDTNLCTGTCPAGLTGAALASYNALNAYRVDQNGKWAGAQPNLTPTLTVTSPGVGVPTVLRIDLSPGGGTDDLSNMPTPTAVTCDLTSEEVSGYRNTNTMQSRYNHTVTMGGFSWTSAGQKTISGACWDSRVPSNRIVVAVPVTVQ